jgi:hypothetical protein
MISQSMVLFVAALSGLAALVPAQSDTQGATVTAQARSETPPIMQRENPSGMQPANPPAASPENRPALRPPTPPAARPEIPPGIPPEIPPKQNKDQKDQ